MTTEHTPESTVDAAPDVEIKNPAAVLAKNRALLTELAEVKAALQTAQDALKTAQESSSAWREKWHQIDVVAPFDKSLDEVSAVPSRFLRQLVTELGLLKFEADAQGVDRPTWFDETGKPADLSKGLKHFMHGVSDRTKGQNELAHLLRGTGASGGGAQPSSYVRFAPAPRPVAPTPAPTPLGLR